MSDPQLGPWPWLNARGEVCHEGPSPELMAYAARTGARIYTGRITLKYDDLRKFLDKSKP